MLTYKLNGSGSPLPMTEADSRVGRVQEYIRACEALLKMGELSDAESLIVEQMTDRLSDEFFKDCKP